MVEGKLVVFCHETVFLLKGFGHFLVFSSDFFYWSQDWIGHQNLSLGDQDLGRINQGTRLSDF
jgi:hypothetical protein